MTFFFWMTLMYISFRIFSSKGSMTLLHYYFDPISNCKVYWIPHHTFFQKMYNYNDWDWMLSLSNRNWKMKKKNNFLHKLSIVNHWIINWPMNMMQAPFMFSSQMVGLHLLFIYKMRPKSRVLHNIVSVYCIHLPWCPNHCHYCGFH